MIILINLTRGLITKYQIKIKYAKHKISFFNRLPHENCNQIGRYLLFLVQH